MKIYKLSQNINNGYDTYDSVVVVAENEDDAKRIHPSESWWDGGFYDEEKKEFWTHYSGSSKTYLFEDKWGTWTNDLSKIKVEYLGEAEPHLKRGVVVASFCAG